MARFRGLPLNYLEAMHLDCIPTIFDTEDVVKYRHWTYSFEKYEHELQKSSNICETIDKYFYFEKRPLSEEEEEFPLAFGLVVYKDIVQIGKRSQWGSYGILDNVYQCFKYLAHSKHNWKYYQYLSGSDLPLRTNLEMVRIMKALNGSINSDIEEFEMDRYRTMEALITFSYFLHAHLSIFGFTFHLISNKFNFSVVPILPSLLSLHKFASHYR
ncbi:Core-2/I-Branching enzyme [Cooperia oncophora]